jgi:hypothetical protein
MFVLAVTVPNITIDWGLLGFVAAIVGIIISILIYIRTGKIQRKQRENEEGFYVTKTKENLKKIQNYFDEIFKIVEEYGNEKNEDKKLATSGLNLYYQKNHAEMVKLLMGSERSLELWISLEPSKKTKFDKVIEDFNWLTNKFFPLNVNDEMREKIWTTEYQTFLTKKYSVDDTLRGELSAEA